MRSGQGPGRRGSVPTYFKDAYPPPPGPGLLEAAADQILGRPFHHPAAERLACVQPMAVVQPSGVRCEVARQLAQRRMAGQLGGLLQCRPDVIAEPGPAVGQQQSAALLQPGRRRGRPLAEEAFARIGDGLGRMVDVEDLVTIAELPRRGIPDRFGPVPQDRDRPPVGDPQPVRPLAPAGGEVVDRLDRREGGPCRWGGQVAPVPTRSRRAKMPIFMSRHPPVVLTVVPSSWNSTSPAAWENRAPAAGVA